MIKSINFFYVLGGLGLFLSSLRFLTAALNRSISRRFKGIVAVLFDSPIRAIATGTTSTVLVQASSITIIASMGLIASSLISLEQGYYAMLGATVGTTAKAWFFAFNIEQWGGVIIGTCSLALVVVRRVLWREFLEICLAVGFTFFGLDLLAGGLAPLSREPQFLGWLEAFNGTTFSIQVMGVAAGCLLTMAVQSSSTVVFLTIYLSSLGADVMTLAGGASLILGANIGTTLTPWLASLEYNANVRRLAAAHVLVKTSAVMITLLLFPYFMALVVLCTQLLGIDGVGTRLAAVHTMFNLLSMVTFGLLGGVVLRIITWILPEPAEREALGLSGVVRRLLTGAPQRALEEADRQITIIEGRSKALLDYNFHLLLAADGSALSHSEEASFRRDFEALRDAVHDLLLRLGRKSLMPQQRQRVEDVLALLGRFQDVQSQGLSLLATLNRGRSDDNFSMPESMQALLETYQSAVDRVWLRIHFRQPAREDELTAMLDAVVQLRAHFFADTLDEAALSPQHHSWIFDVLTRLRLLSEMLVGLARAVSFSEVAGVSTEAVDAPRTASSRSTG